MVLLMKAASWCAGAACIINADIVVSPHLREIVYEAFSRGFEAVTSQRYEFDPATEDYTKAKVVDLGIDFFCALPHVWHEASIRVPNEFRLGHCSWDSWLSSYFNMSLRHRFTSLVKRRCIFHPKHGDRKQPHRIDFKDDYWSARPGFPLPL